MQIKTQQNLLSFGNRKKPAVSVAFTPRSSVGYLVVGIVLGTLLGFILGSVLALNVGDKSLSAAHEIWNRLFGADADGERVHFELLLQ